MGKGDQRTKKGKRVRKSWGVARPRTDKGRGAYTVHTPSVAVAEPPKPKAAPKKKAAPKAAPKPAPVVEEVVEAVAEAPVVEEKAAAVEAPEAEKKAAPAPKKKASSKGDDLKKIEGIGPKIASTLAEAGISSFAELAKAEPAAIAEIIKDVRGNHVPDTWPQQAQLAADGKWDELEKLQDELDGGKKK